MQSPSGHILVFHGSYDPRSQRAAKDLSNLFREKIQYSSQVSQAVGQTFSEIRFSTASGYESMRLSQQVVPVSTALLVQDAYLECVPFPLHDQIIQAIQQSPLGTKLIRNSRLNILPVFLLAGVHVTEDIPAEVAIAQQTLGEVVELTVTPHLGSQMGLRRIINEQMSSLPIEAWILLAHGSRRAGANEAIAELATDLGAVAAFWSIPSSLETQIQELDTLGFRRIGIFPYFLFSGGITDAIAQTITQLSHQYPHLTLTLTKPLDSALPQLADLLMNLVQPAAPSSS